MGIEKVRAFAFFHKNWDWSLLGDSVIASISISQTPSKTKKSDHGLNFGTSPSLQYKEMPRSYLPAGLCLELKKEWESKGKLNFYLYNNSSFYLLETLARKKRKLRENHESIKLWKKINIKNSITPQKLFKF